MIGEAGADRNQLILVGCAAGVIVGSLGLWATVWNISINGTDGDGVLTLVTGAIAAKLEPVSNLLWHRTMLVLPAETA